MKNIYIYIISIIVISIVIFLYINELSSYGISLTTAVIFTAIIALFIIIAGAISGRIYRKLLNKDRKDSK